MPLTLSVYHISSIDWGGGSGANSEDPDQTAPGEQSDQGLHCLSLFEGLTRLGLGKIRIIPVIDAGAPIIKIIKV